MEVVLAKREAEAPAAERAGARFPRRNALTSSQTFSCRSPDTGSHEWAVEVKYVSLQG